MSIDNHVAERLSWDNNRLWARSSLLLVGLFLTLLSDVRGSAAIFAWFMPVPFLLHAALYRGLRNRLWLLLVLIVASVLTLAKSASDPLLMSLAFSMISGTVTGLRFFAAYVLWDYIRQRAGLATGLLAFPVAIVSMEYVQAFFTPLGDWGALVNTQISNLTLLQTSSLVGFLGISALMSWAAVLSASIILNGTLSGAKTSIALFVSVFVALNIYGDLRLDYVPQGTYIRAAAIGTDYTFTGTVPDPQDPSTVRVTDMLIENTRKAAQQGALIAVWAEAATITSQSGEDQFLARLVELATSSHIAIVAAYIVLLPEGSSGHMLNKFVWIRNTGEIAESYRKHHPVPGEGSVPGSAALKLIPTTYGKLAGAICYDFDFPQIGLAYARLGADFVALPGLDWRGMLRRHTLMARMRAIEGGFPVLRAADGATSMAFDSRGQILASMPNFGNNDREMLAYMPIGRTVTLYSRIGNVFAYGAVLALAALLLIAGSNHIRSRK